jgi:hypothetical protein
MRRLKVFKSYSLERNLGEFMPQRKEENGREKFPVNMKGNSSLISGSLLFVVTREENSSVTSVVK